MLDYEDAVDATAGIDPWCSGPDWTLSVRDGFAPDGEPLILERDGGFAVLSAYQLETGSRMFAGFEPLWGFACPLVGASIESVAEAVAIRLIDEPDWERLVLPGFPDDLDLARRAAGPLSRLGEVGGTTGIVRQVARLDGFDQWLSRRSRSFRRNLRNAGRRAKEAGLEIEDVSTNDGLFERLLAIELTSWKGKQGDGIAAEHMSNFYRSLIPRLQRQGRCRCLIALLDGADIGFVLGGIRDLRYRGLQLSYAADMAALSVGHLLQLNEIAGLCAAEVEVYDLGMEMDYKRAWSDYTEASVTLVVERAGRD